MARDPITGFHDQDSDEQYEHSTSTNTNSLSFTNPQDPVYYSFSDIETIQNRTPITNLTNPTNPPNTPQSNSRTEPTLFKQYSLLEPSSGSNKTLHGEVSYSSILNYSSEELIMRSRISTCPNLSTPFAKSSKHDSSSSSPSSPSSSDYDDDKKKSHLESVKAARQTYTSINKNSKSDASQLNQFLKPDIAKNSSKFIRHERHCAIDSSNIPRINTSLVPEIIVNSSIGFDMFPDTSDDSIAQAQPAASIKKQSSRSKESKKIARDASMSSIPEVIVDSSLDHQNSLANTSDDSIPHLKPIPPKPSAKFRDSKRTPTKDASLSEHELTVNSIMNSELEDTSDSIPPLKYNSNLSNKKDKQMAQSQITSVQIPKKTPGQNDIVRNKSKLLSARSHSHGGDQLSVPGLNVYRRVEEAPNREPPGKHKKELLFKLAVSNSHKSKVKDMKQADPHRSSTLRDDGNKTKISSNKALFEKNYPELKQQAVRKLILEQDKKSELSPIRLDQHLNNQPSTSSNFN
jgi:hypothetical protein